MMPLRPWTTAAMFVKPNAKRGDGFNSVRHVAE
jgi:hypothetical protein